MHFDLTVIGTGPGGHVFARMGIGVGAPKLDLPRMLAFKQEAVDGNTKGVEFLFKKNKITGFQGTGRIVGTGKVEVRPDNGEAPTLETKNIVVATGSEPGALKGIDIDEKRIV